MSSSFLSTSTAGNSSGVAGSILAAIGKPLELLEGPTHRGLHRFVPRHPDEIDIDIGDPVYVQREAEDLWCEGIKVKQNSFIKPPRSQGSRFKRYRGLQMAILH